MQFTLLVKELPEKEIRFLDNKKNDMPCP